MDPSSLCLIPQVCLGRGQFVYGMLYKVTELIKLKIVRIFGKYDHAKKITG